jgi:uncharacterized protein YceK
MKAQMIKYPLFIFILLASVLLDGCAGVQKHERAKGSCERGQYWSRSAEACVPVPGP